MSPFAIELFGQREQGLVVGVDELAAELEQLAIFEFVAGREHAPADARRSFVNSAGDAGQFQSIGAVQPGDAGADDRDAIAGIFLAVVVAASGQAQGRDGTGPE